MTKSNAPYLAILGILLVLSSLSVAAIPSSWKGVVRITNATGSNLLATPGTVVWAYLNGGYAASVTTGSIEGSQNGYYLIHVEGNPGDNLTFYVNGVGISGVNSSAQPWTMGVNPGLQPTDLFNLTISTLADGQTCSYSAACTGGYCCSGGTTINARGSSGTCQATVCAAASTPSDTGGGGGSGGGLTGESFILSVITGGTDGTFSYTETDKFGVYQIEVSVSKSAVNVKITVYPSGKPFSAAEPLGPEGLVFKYMQIIKDNLPDADIKQVTIRFIVPKSWIANNKINYKSIRLLRYANGKWVPLKTIVLKEDSGSYYFEALSSGFSYFAIVGDYGTPEAPVVEVKPSCSDSLQNQGETGVDCGGPCSACKVTETPPPVVTPPVTTPEVIKELNINWKPIIEIALIVLIVVVAVLLLITVFKRRKKGKKETLEDLEKEVFGIGQEQQSAKKSKK
jgi:PGF-pre-PGF domain-containing protein